MSHVDEGALHAYLDGALDEFPAAEAERIRAHLDACASCARRLEEERVIRSDAHAMLSLAVPNVEAPSFEELRAYVQRTRERKRGIGRLQRLGWAASIVVAVGAGWMLREGQLHSRALDVGQAQPVARSTVAEPEARSAAEATPSETVATTAEQNDVAAAADDRSFATRAELGTRQSVAARTDAVARGSSSAGAEAELQRPVAAFSEEAMIATSPAPADVAKAGDEADAGLADQEVGRLNTTVTAEAAPEEVGETRAEVPPPAPSAEAVPTDAVSGAGPVTEPGRRARPVVPVALRSALTVDGREESGRAAAEVPDTAEGEAVVGPLLSVPGHEVVEVTNLGEGTTPWGVRVRQRTEDGRVFEVFHLELGIDPSILPTIDEDIGEARAATASGWVLVRGALSDDELVELLARLLPDPA